VQKLIIVSIAIMLASAATGQVHSPTLTERAERDGRVRDIALPENLSIEDWDEIIQDSEVIARVTVLSEESKLSPDEHFVITDYQARIGEVLKDPGGLLGNTKSPITISKVGGALQYKGKPIALETPWFPPLERQKSYVVFLGLVNKDVRGRFGILGFEAGVYCVDGDVASCMTPNRKVRGQPCGPGTTSLTKSVKEKVSAQEKAK